MIFWSKKYHYNSPSVTNDILSSDEYSDAMSYMMASSDSDMMNGQIEDKLPKTKKSKKSKKKKPEAAEEK